MKVVLTPKDILPLIQDLLEKRYPECDGNARVQFVMRRRGLFSSEAEVEIVCELEEKPRS